MKFKSAKPKAPGAYWVRGNGLSRPALVEVVLDDGQLWCNLHDKTTCDHFGYGYEVSALSAKFKWCGPLQEPTA